MTLEIETQNTPQVLPQEFEIGADDIESAIRLAIPAIHHVQAVFGDIKDLNPVFFYQNVTYDLASSTNIENAAEVAQLAINGLHQAEMTLQSEFIYNSPFNPINNIDDPETAVSLREKIISNVVWRSFRPEDNKNGDNLSIQLVKLSKANMHYLNIYNLAEITASPLSFSSEEDFEENFPCLSAEASYIIVENKTELLTLAHHVSPNVLFLFLKGATIDELARTEHKSEELIETELKMSAETVSQIGSEKYNWTVGFTSYVFTSFPGAKEYPAKYLVPTDSDWTKLFADNHTNLPQIMAVIEHLPKLQQMCLLFHWKYIDNNFKVKQWVAHRGISLRLYHTTLQKAYTTFEIYLPSAGYPKSSIKEIVAGCYDHEVIKSTKGRALKESSLPLRIMNLSKDHFPSGTFTRNEQRIITFITDNYAEYHRVPNSLQIGQAINLPTQTVDDRMKWMLDTIPGKDRFADENSSILRDSARYNLILWYKNNLNNDNNDDKLSLLNARQRHVFDLAVTIEHGYYLTQKQLSDGLKKAGVSDKRLKLVYKTILEKLTKT